ncbi:hypothetical protein [Achromobacter sp. UMC71]|uniref:hypothetical protein n=1 Tax=Achromobacter sp. UMC71 TaxID=1862320 RepID=UPI00160369BE|nr:hypothetical protein [Achromobacter sp. UMC71]MBB1626201.1 hypothetical protein [Achromobacter sp. UMC71]
MNLFEVDQQVRPSVRQVRLNRSPGEHFRIADRTTGHESIEPMQEDLDACLRHYHHEQPRQVVRGMEGKTRAQMLDAGPWSLAFFLTAAISLSSIEGGLG